MRKRGKTRGKNPVSKGQKTRAAIVARALRIASAEGLTALTIGRLAQELGMSKSGLFAHFRSKQALELATVEGAAASFAGHVVLAAKSSRMGLDTLWNLCDFWLEHLEQPLFPGGYFFTAAFFQYAEHSGPVPRRIVKVVEEWYDALQKAVEQAQEHKEMDRKSNPSRVAVELNGLLLGAYWAHLLGRWGAFDEARAALLSKLGGLATEKIPSTAFESVRAFRRYLKKRPR